MRAEEGILCLRESSKVPPQRPHARPPQQAPAAEVTQQPREHRLAPLHRAHLSCCKLVGSRTEHIGTMPEGF